MNFFLRFFIPPLCAPSNGWQLGHRGTPQEESTLTVCSAIQKQWARPLKHSFSAWKTSSSIVEKCCNLATSDGRSIFKLTSKQEASSTLKTSVLLHPPHQVTHTAVMERALIQTKSRGRAWGLIPWLDLRNKLTRWGGKEPLTYRALPEAWQGWAVQSVWEEGSCCDTTDLTG